MSSSATRIPSLDGIRGYLMTLVLLTHLAGTRYFPVAREAVPMDLGYLGLRMFFVISGFLITGILLRELNKRGTISLRRFYAKRAFRIFPAYYVLLISVAIAAALGWLALMPGDMLHAWTYTSNYHPEKSWWLGHSWSLSVEEQFYVMWPAILLLAGVRRAAWLAAGFMAVVPLWRTALLALPPGTPGIALFQAAVGHTFDTVGDTIAAGCLLAILRDRLWNTGWYRTVLSTRLMILVPAFTLLVQAMPDLANAIDGNGRYAVLASYELVGRPLVNLTLAMMVDWSMRNAESPVGRLLNTPIAVRVGIMSYSIYLWQQIFLNRHSDHILNSFPLNLVLTFAVAWLSHRYVETPFLAWRDRIDQRERERERERAATAPTVAIAAVPAGSAPSD